MKRKKILIIILTVFIFLILLLVFNTFFNRKSEEGVHYKKRVYVSEKENGWYYYLESNIVDKENLAHYFFDGCNLKYKTMEGYNILMFDEQENIIGRMPTFPTLSVSEKKKNGVMERDEILQIDNYFDEKQFGNKIELSDLNDLNIINFEKEELIELYNNLQNKTYQRPGDRFSHLDTCTIHSEKNRNDEVIQIGLLVGNSTIQAIHIDIKYSNEQYLSDLINNGKANSQQKNIYEIFQNAKDYIIKNNRMTDIPNTVLNSQNELENRLLSLLNTTMKG